MEIKNHLDIKGHVKPGSFTAEELGKVTAEAGAIAYNSTVKELQVYDGASWKALASNQEAAPSSNLIDEDDMSSDSSSRAPTQQSVKAYSDAIKSDVSNITSEVNTTKSNITSIQGDVTNLQSDLTTVEGQVSNINSDLTVVKKDIVSLGGEIVLVKDNINNIEGDITTLYTNVTTVKADVTDIKSDVSTVEGDLITLQTDVTSVENEVTNVKSSISTISTNISSIQTEVQSTSSKLVNENNFSSNSTELIPSQASVKSYVDSKTFDLIDEDDLSSDKEDAAPSQQSVKAYVDNIHTTIKSDITDINTSQAFLEGDLTTFKSNVNTLKSDLETEIQTVKTLTDTVKTSVEEVKTQADNQALEVADENDFSSNSTTKVPSQASVKAYVDAVDSKTFDLLDEDNFVSDREDAAPSQQSVKVYVDAVDTKVTSVKTYADTIKGSVDTIEAEVTAAKTELATVKSEVTSAPPLVDEDDFSSNSATSVPSQASVKYYVDSQITANKTVILDEDDFKSDSSTQAASQQSVKAYVEGIKASLEAKDIELLDEDDFASDSDTKGATQQSIKEYVKRKNSNIIYIDPENGDNTKDGKTTGTAFKDFTPISDGTEALIKFVSAGSLTDKTFTNCNLVIDHRVAGKCFIWTLKFVNSKATLIGSQYASPYNSDLFVSRLQQDNSEIKIEGELHVNDHVRLENASKLTIYTGRLKFRGSPVGVGQPALTQLTDSTMIVEKTAYIYYCGHTPETDGSGITGYEHHFELNNSDLEFKSKELVNIQVKNGYPSVSAIKMTNGSSLKMFPRDIKFEEEWPTSQVDDDSRIFGYIDYPNGFKVDPQYSYTETKTDKLWIDNKVIYRQAITGNLVNKDSVTVLSGVSDIVNFSLFAGFNGGAAHYALPYNNNNGSINVFRESDGSVKVSCDRSDFASGVSLRGIVEYTKTS